MRKINVRIPTGYRILARTESIQIDRAVALLSGRSQRRYTRAFRPEQGFFAELTRHVLACPYCGYELPAYARYLDPVFKRRRTSSDRVSPQVIEEWGSGQVRFFQPTGSTLVFNTVCMPKEEFRCPKCDNRSLPDQRLREVVVSYSKNAVKIACEVLGLEEVMALPWLPEKQLILDFPLYETVTFNFRNGHTHVLLGDAEGERVAAKRDVTAFPESLENGCVYRVLTSHVRVARLIKRLFEQRAKEGPLPFAKDELTPDKLALMTQFVGFDRSFYDAVPYAGESCRVERSFKGVARNLHTQERARRYFERSSLPKIKSVRRLYFSKTGLLFYLPEGELLWELLQDPNLFCRVMETDGVYERLSVLHQRTGMAEFLRDYRNVKGAAALADRLIGEWYYLKRYAINYCSMSRQMKARERGLWRDRDYFYCHDESDPGFSRPFCVPERRIRDCRIDGFRFFWLRTSRDYLMAGAALDNCLGEWGSGNNPVVCVEKERRIVAAIEVRRQMVLQAQGYSNSSLGNVPGLENAYKKWREKYALREMPRRPLGDFDAEDLPF